jgi:hypothetical protein
MPLPDRMEGVAGRAGNPDEDKATNGSLPSGADGLRRMNGSGDWSRSAAITGEADESRSKQT